MHLTGISTPVASAIAAFTTALVNAIVVLGVWHATPEQISTVNTVVLAGIGLVASLRAGAQSRGTLTATPDGNGNGTQ